MYCSKNSRICRNDRMKSFFFISAGVTEALSIYMVYLSANTKIVSHQKHNNECEFSIKFHIYVAANRFISATSSHGKFGKDKSQDPSPARA